MDQYDRFFVLPLAPFVVPPSDRPYFTQMDFRTFGNYSTENILQETTNYLHTVNIDKLSVAKSHKYQVQLRD